MKGLNLGSRAKSLSEIQNEREHSGNLNLNLNGISNFNLQPYQNKDSSYHPALDWNERQVLIWLNEVQLNKYERYFIEHDINGEVLLELDHSLLKMMAIPTVGARVRILLAIKNLKRHYFEKLRDQIVPKQEVESIHSSLEVLESNFQSPKLSPLGTFSSLFLNKNRSSDGTSKSNKGEKSRSKQLFDYTTSPPTSPDATTPFTNPFMSNTVNKQNCVRVYGNDGEIRIVDVSDSKDAHTILKKVLTKFNILDEPEKYAIFVVNGDSTRSLNDDELVDICNSSDRPEKGKFILRKKHNPMSHLDFKQLKARKHVGRKVEVTPNLPNSKTDKLTKIFGKRPPSELITQDLSNFFPEAGLGPKAAPTPDKAPKVPTKESELRPKTKGQPNGADFLQLLDIHTPRLSASTDTKPLPPQPLYGSILSPVLETAGSTLSSELSPTGRSLDLDRPNRVVEEQKWIKGPLIGAGSFGDVYLGLNPTNGELMAVKQVGLPTSLSSKEVTRACEQRIQALQREIELLKDMDHPNIVRYFGSQIEDNHLNILLEYVPGGSVSGLLADYGPFEERLVAIFVKQILTGLDFLHKQNIIHRDIKGGNILVDNKGKVKITDFGVSKKLQEEVLSAVTNHRASLQGSIFWMAPEVVKQTTYTKKADIWGLGCLVVEMMTGLHPFPHFTQMQAIFQIGSDAAPEIPEHATPLSRDFLNQTFTIDHRLRPDAATLLTHMFITDPPTPTTNPNSLTSPSL